MTGELFIDSIDAFNAWGLGVAQGGYKGLVGMPPLKTYQSNDWQEVDGIEADLSAPVLNTREFTMDFYCTKGESGFDAFLSQLKTASYHVFNFVEIGRSFKLRLVSHSKYDSVQTLQLVTIKFADDFPLPDYTYSAPTEVPISVQESGYSFDGGNDLADYGIYVLQGSKAEVLKGAAVKPALLRNIPTQAGAIYDEDALPKHKAKDIKLSLLMRAESLSQLWHNWDALLYDLIRAVDTDEQPDGRVFTTPYASFPFCYKSCSVKTFDPDGKPWLEFSLTITNLQGTNI